MSLISKENSRLKNAMGIALAVVVVPVAIVAKLLLLPFERPTQRSEEEVAEYLRNFLEGKGDEWDWDEFVSCPLSDPKLEEIRQSAAGLALPLDEDGCELLECQIEHVSQLINERKISN